MQSFRRLEIWKRAHAHALTVRRATNSFPRRGFTSLKSQMIRAAESIPFNIAEGCGASTRREFARFLDISVKSSFELEYQLQLAHDNAILPQHLWVSLTTETVEIRKMMCAFRRTLLERDQDKDVGRLS